MSQKKNKSNREEITKRVISRIKGSRNYDKVEDVYFSEISIESIRCFKQPQKVYFSDENKKPKQWTIILGNNGTGKTTILQSLVAMLPSDYYVDEWIDHSVPKCSLIEDDFFDNWHPFREKNQLSKLEVVFSEKVNIYAKEESVLSYAAKGTVDWNSDGYISKNIKINCFGYGASRKTGNTSLSEKNASNNSITLFNESSLLINPEEWLLHADYAASRATRFKKQRRQNVNKVKDVLVRVLPDIDEIKISERQRDGYLFGTPTVEFHTHYGWVEAKDLSLGYRTLMAWIVDFASRMFDIYPESENPLTEPAVVLIDEIDLHLHPKWQRDLLPWLSDLFPNTQFIVTTHSPLIVQSAVARDANIVVCQREGDHVVIDQSTEAVKNWRADQILTSDLFGLETARSKELEKDLEERQEILSKAKLTKKDKERLAELEEKIGSVPVMENPKYDEAMDLIMSAADKIEKENGNRK